MWASLTSSAFARTHALSVEFAGGGRGVLLGLKEMDAYTIFGLTPPRIDGERDIPGRAWWIQHGAATLIQVAQPAPQAEPTSTHTQGGE
ncbi:MAG: hypothetical protein Q4G21_07990 [Dermabacter sp.]|nr:hypothetical protein [Dermabacter sp.]